MHASEDDDDLEQQTQHWSDRLAQFGLRRNVKKTDCMTNEVNEPTTIQADGNELPRTDFFKYLDSTLSAD